MKSALSQLNQSTSFNDESKSLEKSTRRWNNSRKYSRLAVVYRWSYVWSLCLFMALISALVLCTRYQASLLSVSVSRVPDVFPRASCERRRKPCPKTRETAALRSGASLDCHNGDGFSAGRSIKEGDSDFWSDFSLQGHLRCKQFEDILELQFYSWRSFSIRLYSNLPVE